MGVPSDHLMSSRSFIVIVLPSAEMPPLSVVGSSFTNLGCATFFSSKSQAQQLQICCVTSENHMLVYRVLSESNSCRQRKVTTFLPPVLGLAVVGATVGGWVGSTAGALVASAAVG